MSIMEFSSPHATAVVQPASLQYFTTVEAQLLMARSEAMKPSPKSRRATEIAAAGGLAMTHQHVLASSSAYRGNEGNFVPLVEMGVWRNKLEIDGNHHVVCMTTQGGMLLTIPLEEVSGGCAGWKIVFVLRHPHDVFDSREEFGPDLHTPALLPSE
jgi:hypothetical protein